MGNQLYLSYTPMLPGDNYSMSLNVKLYLVESVTQASSHYKVIVSYGDAPFIN